MQVALDLGEHDEVERYAAALEDYTRPEPLPWSEFFVPAAGLLPRSAVAGAMRRGPELPTLRGEGERLGLKIALPSIEAALADAGARLNGPRARTPSAPPSGGDARRLDAGGHPTRPGWLAHRQRTPRRCRTGSVMARHFVAGSGGLECFR